MRFSTLVLLSCALTISASAQTSYTWFGGNGDWTDSANWSPSGVPGSGDSVLITAGTATLSGNTTVAELDIRGLAVITGNADFTVTETLNWSAGGGGWDTFRGTGDVIVDVGATLTMMEPTIRYRISGGRTLVNNGLTIWEGSGSWDGSGLIVNNGEMVLAFEEVVPFIFSSFDDTLLNSSSGLIRRTGTGEADLNAGFSNEGVVRVEQGILNFSGFNANGGTDTGQYEVEEGGTLIFSGGNRMLTESVEVSGTGTVAISYGIGALTNNAMWMPGDSPGVLTMDSDYDAGNSTLVVEIGGLTAGTDYDQLDVMGEAMISGTLEVVLTGGFTPQEGDRFLIIPATDGATGSFDTLDLPSGLEAYVETSAIGAELVIGEPVANEAGSNLPGEFALHVAYPNPFNPQATIPFDVPEMSDVRLALYDALGREVHVLVNGQIPAGRHSVQVDGRGLASGLYLVRMTTGNGSTQTQRITLLK